MPVHTFNAKDVIVTVGGLLITGFRDGDKITVERDGELWTKKVGVDGAVMRSRNYQSIGGKITIGLMYGVEANAALEGLKTLDLVTGHAPVPISVVDINGGSNIFAATCWLESDVGPTFGSEPGDMEWVFSCAQLEITAGVLRIDP